MQGNEINARREGLPPAGPEDRRSGMRARVQRRARVFVGIPDHVARDATIVDMGARGVGLETDAPLTPGQTVELEVLDAAASSAASPIFVSGRIVWVEATPSGRSLAGIDTTWAPATMLVRAAAIEPAVDVEPDLGPLATEPPRVAAPRPSLSPSRPTRLQVSILVLLLAILGAWLFGATERRAAESAVAGAREANARTVARGMPSASEAVRSEAMEPGAGGLQSTPLTNGVFAAREPAEPVARFVARLDRARIYERTGRRDAAIGQVQAVVAANADVPAHWREVAESYLSALMASGRRSGPGVLPEEATLGFPRMAAADQATDGAMPGVDDIVSNEPKVIVIDLDSFSLLLYENGHLHAVYPVGFGRDETTPEGRFYIANKIERPDWYNRGEAVPYGDPRNPLGDFWMGLARADARLPIGIHPTADATSIGRAESRGCIRMRPQDAAAVFAWCETGVPVVIGDVAR